LKLSTPILQGFVGSILAKRFDDAKETPQFHLELWDLATGPDQFVAIAAPRGHAKSTGGTLAYGLAELLFRSSKYCLIVSDTEAQAAMFVSAMKQEISENEALIDLFGVKRNEKNLVHFIKDTETDFIVQFEDGATFRVMGKGAEQKLRGLLWDGKRPDLIIVDDLENDELVMNKDRRDKLKRWFNGALIPCMAVKGKMRMWGTILHMDSVLEGLMPNDKYTKDNGIKVWSEYPWKRMWKAVKYRAHNPDFTQILWTQRFTKDFFKTKMEEASRNGMMDLYSQEYLNNPLDESVAYFKRGDFQLETEEDRKKIVRHYITIDPAISTESRSDYTVFLVAAIDENRGLHIRNVIRERLDAREIVDTILALQKTYDPEAIGIEHMMVSQSLGPFLRESMIKENIYPNIVSLKHGGKDKVTRARSIQGRMRAKSIKFDKQQEWYPAFEEELLRFPRGVKDDQVDAFAWLGMLLDMINEAPTEKEEAEEEYQDELRKSNESGATGRSKWTGY
jgi:predicted phage terminase large subunit-like protein